MNKWILWGRSEIAIALPWWYSFPYARWRRRFGHEKDSAWVCCNERTKAALARGSLSWPAGSPWWPRANILRNDISICGSSDLWTTCAYGGCELCAFWTFVRASLSTLLCSLSLYSHNICALYNINYNNNICNEPFIWFSPHYGMLYSVLIPVVNNVLSNMSALFLPWITADAPASSKRRFWCG